MLLSLLFAALPAMSQPQSIAYEATVNPKATSYYGEKFNHHLKYEITYLVNSPVAAKAETSEKTYCDYDDNSQVVSCSQYCDTNLKFSAGSIMVKITDLDSGEVLNNQQELTAGFYKSVEKGNLAACETPNLGFESAFSEHLQKETHFKNAKRMAGASIGDFTVFRGEHVLRFALLKKDGNTYEASLAAVDQSPELFWNYYETEIWGVSDRIRLNLKLK